MKKKLIRPTDEEDALITAAALSDPDALPLTDSELKQFKQNLVASACELKEEYDFSNSAKNHTLNVKVLMSYGSGIGQTVQLNQGFDAAGNDRDSDQWYLQATYTIPGVGTKLGTSYGESTLDGNTVDGFRDQKNSMWTVGAYHPLTKHLNLVAEYSDVKSEVNNKVAGTDLDGKSKTVSLGAILFF